MYRSKSPEPLPEPEKTTEELQEELQTDLKQRALDAMNKRKLEKLKAKAQGFCPFFFGLFFSHFLYFSRTLFVIIFFHFLFCSILILNFFSFELVFLSF